MSDYIDLSRFDIGSGMSEMKYCYSKTMNNADDIAQIFADPLCDIPRLSSSKFTMDEILTIRSYGVDDFDENKKNTHSYIVYNKARGLGLRLNFMYISKEKSERYKKTKPNYKDSTNIRPLFLNPCTYSNQDIISSFMIITDDDLKEDNDRLGRAFLEYMTVLLIHNIEKDYNVDLKNGIEFSTSGDMDNVKNIQLYTRLTTMIVSMLFELTHTRSVFDYKEENNLTLYHFCNPFVNHISCSGKRLEKLFNDLLISSCQHGFIEDDDPAFDDACFIVQDFVEEMESVVNFIRLL